MKKLLIAATLTAAALGTTSLLADSGHQRGQHQSGATENCTMSSAQGRGTEHTAQHGQRHAGMQARMQAMHASMGSHEGRGRDRGAQEEHQH